MESIAKTVLDRVSAMQSAAETPFLIAIDGRCASGKTTLASRLQAALGCPVFHMDDFFLRPEQRTEARLDTPGGNVDYERFLVEVLQPLSRGAAFSFRPYDCQSRRLLSPVSVAPAPVAVVEGTYACHPALTAHYALRVFLTVDPAAQFRRIEARNGAEGLARFRSLWIPLEELYFRECHPETACALRFDTTFTREI